MELEGLGLANDSNLGGAALWHATVAAHGVTHVDGGVQRDEAGQRDAQGADDLAAHGLGDGLDAPADLHLEQGQLHAIGGGTGGGAHLAGDLFRGEALGDPQQSFKLTWRQGIAELASPFTAGDRFHNLSRWTALVRRQVRATNPSQRAGLAPANAVEKLGEG